MKATRWIWPKGSDAADAQYVSWCLLQQYQTNPQICLSSQFSFLMCSNMYWPWSARHWLHYTNTQDESRFHNACQMTYHYILIKNNMKPSLNGQTSSCTGTALSPLLVFACLGVCVNCDKNLKQTSTPNTNHLDSHIKHSRANILNRTRAKDINLFHFHWGTWNYGWQAALKAIHCNPNILIRLWNVFLRFALSKSIHWLSTVATTECNVNWYTDIC